MSNSNSSSSPPRFRRKGFQFFGLGLQDFIKYFFGGNASFAIFALVLICWFLLSHGFSFFPSYYKELKDYRRTGQEFVDNVKREVDAHTRISSEANIAYYAEVNRTSLEEDLILSAYRSVGSAVRSATYARQEQLDRYTKRVGKLEKELEELSPEADEREEVSRSLTDYQGRVKKLQESIVEENKADLSKPDIWEDIPGRALTKDEMDLVRTAVLHDQAGNEGDHPGIKRLKEQSSAKKSIEKEKLAEYKSTISEISKAVRPLKTLFREMTQTASDNAREAKKFSTAQERYEALLKAAVNVEEDSEKKRYREQAEAVDRTEPEYGKLIEPLLEKREEHAQLSRELAAEMTRLVVALPTSVETRSAIELLSSVRENAAEFPSIAEESRQKMAEWKYDEPISFFRPVTAFFFGKDWTSNSSWRDFYGVLPLLTGSFLISLIALTVAVPFALSAAIYVNQLAGVKEQNFIKPVIEFIQAIPSVVLGFFGILVLGTFLRDVSEVEWLSWVPGFPMAQRLNILNAGLLLALMAVPTIFTLAEDALNNVPRALTENSLAIGASKLQTVLRIVFPASVSGIIAAVLLGFGRIIGETMVVLLVAGNKIKIPDFSAGLGVVTQPTHTMTGIIAQELPEVNQGSLHWGALFMVGLVLFFMSLAINFTAQRVLKKFQKF